MSNTDYNNKDLTNVSMIRKPCKPVQHVTDGRTDGRAVFYSIDMSAIIYIMAIYNKLPQKQCIEKIYYE